jgi:hypothetical protein
LDAATSERSSIRSGTGDESERPPAESRESLLATRAALVKLREENYNNLKSVDVLKAPDSFNQYQQLINEIDFKIEQIDQKLSK